MISMAEHHNKRAHLSVTLTANQLQITIA
uniref:Uncharacterized protein n=1 Tax=Rhizophora mucronata TaxID=61149 RepID=A0A2P2PTR7_RHIMU